VLLGSQHEDSEDEFGGKEHLDEETTNNGRATSKTGSDTFGSREKTRDDGGSSNATEDLREYDDSATNPGNSANQAHAKGNLAKKVREVRGRQGKARLTAGLKRPPVIRKKTQALTASEKPNPRAT